MSSGFSFLRSRSAQILTALLLVQAAVFYGAVNTPERVPLVRPLSEFPTQLGPWSLEQEGVVEQEVQDVLQADDLLNRTYRYPDYPLAANLFIAYFQTQRTGKAPHSPRNCLPGSGWEQINAGTETDAIPGGPEINVNRYVVAKGQSRSLVMYWYQSHNRVVASEYWAKIYLVLDSIRLHRSDTSLVRVVVPIIDGNDDEANRAAVSFVQSFFHNLERYFPA
jgi:EpsI family protein